MKKIVLPFAFGLIFGLIGGVFGYRAWITRFPTGNPFTRTEAASDPFLKAGPGQEAALNTLPKDVPVYAGMKFRSKYFNNGKSDFVFSAEGSGEDIYKFYQEHFAQAGWRRVDRYDQRWTKDRTVCDLDVQGSSTGNDAGIPTSTITFEFTEVTAP